jgi:hypothetical protein
LSVPFFNLLFACFRDDLRDLHLGQVCVMIPGTSERLAIRAAGSVGLIVIAVVGIGIALIGVGSWLAIEHPTQEARNPPIINNAPRINTPNQGGGTNPLAFDRAMADQLVGKLPTGKPIDVVAVGSPADWGVAGQYAEYLKTKGFKVTLSRIGMIFPPPDQKIKIGDASDPRVGVIIAPSAF